MLRLLLAGSALVALALPVASGSSMVKPTLTAKVTATKLTLTQQDGARVRTLQPNVYRIVVHDSTTAQNFHLVSTATNAIDKGVVVTEAGLDMDGLPHGGMPDLGAYELR